MKVKFWESIVDILYITNDINILKEIIKYNNSIKKDNSCEA